MSGNSSSAKCQGIERFKRILETTQKVFVHAIQLIVSFVLHICLNDIESLWQCFCYQALVEIIFCFEVALAFMKDRGCL